MQIALEKIKIGIENGAIVSLLPKDGENFVGAPVPLWEVTLRNRQGGKSAFVSTDYPQQDKADGLLTWDAANDTASCRVTVQIAADGDNLTNWKIRITELPGDWTVFQVKFPCYDWKLEATDNYRMILPTDRGLEMTNPLKTLPDKTELWVRRKFRERKYPNCFATMQCFGLFSGNNLLYFAAHDPVPAVKTFYFEPDEEAGVIRMRPSLWTGYRYGEDYESFPWAFGMGTGTWFDVALFYRKFALTASWTKEGSLEDSCKTPRWYQDTPMVLLKDYRGELYDADAFVKVAEYLQVPLLLHYYLWHKPAFDTDYPFLFPTIPEFRQDIKKLQAAGVRVMPYLNAYSADTAMDCWPQMEPMAIRKNEQLELHAQVWSQNRALAAMCPAHPLWQRILNSISMRCAEMGLDAIYYDEVACSPSHNCYAEDHTHTPGDEYAFVAGHRKIMRDIRREGREINPDLIFTSESAAEPYMDVLDGYLVGNGNAPNEVPVFEAVYHDYTITFGQYVFSNELDDPKCTEAISGKCARQFITGAQFGWTRIPMLAIIERRPEVAAFIKTLAHAKYKHADFLTRGRMLRPLTLDVPTVKQTWLLAWNDHTGTEITLPAVLHSIWIRNDTSIAVVMVNISHEDVQVSIDLGDHQDDYPLPQAGIVRLWEHSGSEAHALIAEGDSDHFKCTIKPFTVVVASIGSEKPYGVHSPLD